MKIIIPGGTGFIGQALATYFGEDHSNTIIILTRNIGENNNGDTNFRQNFSTKNNIHFVVWDGKSLGDWYKHFDGADLVINLAGKSVNCRYTAKNKQAIFDSRTQSTSIIGEAIRKVNQPPKLWINAASATIYPHATNKPFDEFTTTFKDGFSVQVCKLWEQTFFAQQTPNTRKVALRTAITLGKDGVMKAYLNLCRFGLGGRQGNGRQMYSWLHIQDLCRIIAFIHQHEDMQGVYNASAPNAVTNTFFMQTLRKLTGTSFGLPAAKWMVKFGAFVIGTEAELVLKSRWVLPTKLQNAGFNFKYPDVENALANVIASMPT